MPKTVYTNNTVAYLNTAVSPTDTTIVVGAGQGAQFPAVAAGGEDQFFITVEDRRLALREIMLCTSRTVDSLTVTRAQEGTVATAFSAGTSVSNRVTAGFLNAIDTRIVDASELAEAAADAAALALSTANAAAATANAAKATADATAAQLGAIQITADGADAKATQALATADAAATAAGAAQAAADNAVAVAGSAQTAAADATVKAQSASDKADAAIVTANNAQSSADATAAQLDDIQATADAALLAANDALTKATDAEIAALEAADAANAAADAANAAAAAVLGYLPLTGGTLSGNLVMSGTSPAIRFLETDAVSPAGQFAFFGANSGDLYCQRYTGGNFTAGTNVWRYLAASDAISLDKPINVTATIKGTQPDLRFVESDIAAPGGGYRFIGASGNIYLQRSTAPAVDFTTTVSVWDYVDSTGIFTVTPPTTFNSTVTVRSSAPSLSIHETDQALDMKRWQMAVDASAFIVRPANDAATALNGGLILERNTTGLTNARLTGTAVAVVPPTADSLLTMARSDNRYLQLTGGAITGALSVAGNASFAGSLQMRSGYPTFHFQDTTPSGEPADLAISGGNTRLRFGTADTAGNLVSDWFTLSPTGAIVYTGYLEMRGVYPDLRFTETDVTSPAGQYGFNVDADIFNFQKFTGAGFTSPVNIFRYIPSINALDLDVPLRDGVIIEGGSSTLRFRETDQTDPVGSYALSGGSGDFSLFRYAGANWASPTAIWSYENGSDVLTFTTPVVFDKTVNIAGTTNCVSLVASGALYAISNIVSGSDSASNSEAVAKTSISPGVINVRRAGTANQTHINICNNQLVSPATVGTINSSGSTTAYNTTSDENLKDFTGLLDPQRAIDILRTDPPREFDWKDGSGHGVGWGAQTSYEISPDLASPPPAWEPDEELYPGVREAPLPGEPGYAPWGMDLSKRVPYLAAALLSALDKIDALEARLEALEGPA